MDLGFMHRLLAVIYRTQIIRPAFHHGAWRDPRASSVRSHISASFIGEYTPTPSNTPVLPGCTGGIADYRAEPKKKSELSLRDTFVLLGLMSIRNETFLFMYVLTFWMLPAKPLF